MALNNSWGWRSINWNEISMSNHEVFNFQYNSTKESRRSQTDGFINKKKLFDRRVLLKRFYCIRKCTYNIFMKSKMTFVPYVTFEPWKSVIPFHHQSIDLPNCINIVSLLSKIVRLSVAILNGCNNWIEVSINNSIDNMKSLVFWSVIGAVIGLSKVKIIIWFMKVWVSIQKWIN